MKTPLDPRHKKRQKVIQQLFAYSFLPKQAYHPPINKIVKNLEKIDCLIANAAPQFPIEKLNKIDLAILRLSVFELNIERRQPPKVIIDEAVELGKEYGSENSPKFINGVLGTILRSSLETKR